MQSALEAPERPVAAIVGGAKVSTKLDLLGNLLAKVDVLAIGGAMANTFLHALGTDVGKSLCEAEMAGTAREILARADAEGCEIALPSDAVVAREFKAGAPGRDRPGDGRAGRHDDPRRRARDRQRAGAAGWANAGRWCGTARSARSRSRRSMPAPTRSPEAAADLTRGGTLKTVAGGGDTVAALAHAGVLDEFSYVSTAGGAFLEWLEGKTCRASRRLRPTPERSPALSGLLNPFFQDSTESVVDVVDAV